MLRDKSIGIVIFRCSQLAVLSPVQIAPASPTTKVVTDTNINITQQHWVYFSFQKHTKSLGPSKEGAWKDKRSLWATWASYQTLHCGHVLWENKRNCKEVIQVIQSNTLIVMLGLFCILLRKFQTLMVWYRWSDDTNMPTVLIKSIPPSDLFWT